MTDYFNSISDLFKDSYSFLALRSSLPFSFKCSILIIMVSKMFSVGPVIVWNWNFCWAVCLFTLIEHKIVSQHWEARVRATNTLKPERIVV